MYPPPRGAYRKKLRRPGCKLRPKPRHLFREIWETCFSSCKKYQFLTSSSQIQFFSFYNIRRCFCLLHVVLQFLCFSLLLVLMIFFNVYYYLSFIILLFNSIFRRSIIYSWQHVHCTVHKLVLNNLHFYIQILLEFEPTTNGI